MKLSNLPPLFLLFLLITIIPLSPLASGATVVYNGLVWDDGQAVFCNDTIIGVDLVVLGLAFPNDVAYIDYFNLASTSTEDCMTVDKTADCDSRTSSRGDFPCWFEGTYHWENAGWVDGPSNPTIQMMILGQNETSYVDRGFGSNFRNDLTLCGITPGNQCLSYFTSNGSATATPFGQSPTVLGATNVCSINGSAFLPVTNDMWIDFVIQMRTYETFDIWLGGKNEFTDEVFPWTPWCRIVDSSNGLKDSVMGIGIGMGGSVAGGSGTPRSVNFGYLQGFGCVIAPAHSVNATGVIDCSIESTEPIEEQDGAPGEPIPAPPNPFGVGNQTSFIILTVEDDRGNFRNQFANSETMIFDASLQFINDTSGLVQDAPVGSVVNLFRFDEFFDAFTLVGSEPTIDRFNGLGPRARFPTVHIDDIVPTTNYRANYTGSFSANLTASISNEQTIITIDDAQIPLSIGTRLSPPSVEGTTLGPNVQGPLLASDIQRKELFNHGDNFRVSTFLTRIDTGAGLVDQTVFLELQINSTGPFIRLETITTNDVGRATSQFRTWDNRFIGAQVFRFRYFASAPFVNSSSVNATIFVSSQASDFRLTLEIIPSTVRPGDRIELRGQLTNIGSSSIGIPLSNRKIEIFVSSFDKTGFFNLQVTQNLALNIRTNDQGFYSHIIFGPNIGGVGLETMDFFSNSTINNIVATSPNATLTITVSTAPPTEIADVVPPNFFVFNALIDNPQANCQFPDPKICSTMLWMIVVFIVSSVLAMMAGGLKIPGTLIGLGWLFMMLGGMIIGVFVQAVLEVLLFIGALPVVVVLVISIGAILRGGSPAVTTA